VRTVCEPIFNKPLAEISFSQVLMRLFRVAQRFDVEIQPQMILLHKTLFNIEGLGRDLYPELDLWKTARPVLRTWMDEQVGPQAMIADIREHLPQVRHAMRELPNALQNLSEQLSSGEIKVQLDTHELEEMNRSLERQRTQRFWLAVAGTAVISGTIVLTLGSEPWLGWSLVGAGVVAGAVSRW